MSLLDRIRNESVRLTAFIFGVMLVGLLWAGIYVTTQDEKKVEISQAVKNTDRYARTFAEHTLRTLYGLDEIALLLKYEAERQGPNIDIAKLAQGKRFEGQPFVQLSVADASGTIVASHIVPFAQVNIGDLEHFAVHRASDSGKAHISVPLQGRISGKWTMHMSRRVNKPDGSFGGVAVVGIDPGYFAEFYRQVELGKDASITLMGRDGIVRVRQDGAQTNYGTDLRQSVVMEKLKKVLSGSFSTKSQIDGIVRVYSYLTLQDFPLVVLVGVSEKEELAGYSRRVNTYYAAGTAISFLITAFTALLLAGISRQKKTEKALRQSENRLRTYFNESRSVMLLIDRKSGRIVDANPAAADFYGYSLDRLQSMNICEINTLSPEYLRELMGKATARFENVFHFPHRLANGEIRTVDVYSTPIDIKDEVLLLSIIHDVTDRIRLEAELKTREQSLQSIVDSTQAGTWEWNVQTGETKFNERWAEIVGYTLDELNPVSIETWLKLAHPADLEVSGRRLQEHFEGKESFYRCDSRMRHKNGSWVWVYDSGKVISRSADGKPLIMTGTHTDITMRKMMEEELRYSKERYQKFVDQSFEAIAIIDSETRQVVEMNRKFTEIFGYSLPEDAPMFADRFMLDSQSVADAIFDLLKKQRFLPVELRVFGHKNGKKIAVARTATVINIHGRDYILVSLRDMTEEQKRQAELKRDVLLAQKVQKDLLPQVEENPFADIRTLYYPAKFISGDSYYMAWNKDENILHGFLIDVSGHGLATAIQTASISTLLRDFGDGHLTLLNKVKLINLRAAGYFTEGAYGTAIGFELDLSRKVLRYVGAGITRFRANGNIVKVPGMFLGLWGDAEFTSGEVAVSEGDTFHFLSDGFTDVLETEAWRDVLSPDGRDFEGDVRRLERLGESGKLCDDASGICLKILKISDAGNATNRRR